MEKKLIAKAFFLLVFIALFFVSCGTGSSSSGATFLHAMLTGGDVGDRYVVSYDYNDLSFFTRGFIDSRGHIFPSKQNIQNLAAKFSITGSRFTLTIYEGQTLPNDILCFVYAEKLTSNKTERRLVGKLYLTLLDGTNELNYMEYGSSATFGKKAPRELRLVNPRV